MLLNINNMTTVTISLPSEIAKKVDSETQKSGFATRSEFIRSLIRRHFRSNEMVFEPFTPRPLQEIEEGLRKTGKYNDKFIKSVIKGLRDNSSFYEGKNS